LKGVTPLEQIARAFIEMAHSIVWASVGAGGSRVFEN
jgi:hypothetical protein